MEVIKGSVVVKVTEEEMDSLSQAMDLLSNLMEVEIDLAGMEGYNEMAVENIVKGDYHLGTIYDELGLIYRHLQDKQGVLEIKPEY